MRWSRPSGLTVLSVALLVLLPTLAALQYRWAGQISVAEQERMQRNLQNAATQFRAAFDQEIFRAFGYLQVGPNTARDGRSEQYSDRYESWLDTTEFPEIVANVFLVDAPDDILRARRFDPSTHELVEVAWPATLGPFRAEFDLQRQAFNADDPFARRLALPDAPSLLVAAVRVRRAPGDTISARPSFGYSIIELDMRVIVDQVLPALARRFFTHSNGDNYRVAVVDATDTGRAIYQSDPAVPVLASQADATEPFFDVRPGFFFGRRGNAPGGDTTRLPNAGDPRNLDPLGPPASRGRWLVAVQHSSGSLEGAVAAVRRRNLGISFGVLLLLSVSVALLAQASRRAQRLARLQMEFVAGVSHELRTPIAVIRSAAENLSLGVVGNADRVKQYGKVMEGEARRLGEMVESVLQYAGVESGQTFASAVPHAVGDIIEQALGSARRSVGETVEIERQIAPNLPPVMGDPAALTSAVQNLIVNAIKYGGDSRWVGVRASHVARGRHGDVHITVEDRGPGIASSDLPHIFEPFYRGAGAKEQQIHGNGLGLSLVQRIAKAHGGSVQVRTGESGGATFTLVVPAAAPMTHADVATSDAQATAH